MTDLTHRIAKLMSREFLAGVHPDQIAAKVEAMVKEESMWQPIETAPLDGADVLVMYMHIQTQCVFNAFYAAAEEGWNEEDIGWWSYEHSEVSRIKLDEWMTPTHWMPLPPSPCIEAK